MAKYYDYGIDLGTTNSCVAKQSNSDIIVYQNLDNMKHLLRFIWAKMEECLWVAGLMTRLFPNLKTQL